MKKDFTEIVFILDKSGSMAGLESDTIGGYNAMMVKQKKNGSQAAVSTVLFDQESKVLHDRLPLDEVPEMTAQDYQVGGCTALLDAFGSAIRHISNIHKYARTEDRPDKTIFVITTDGMENASRQYSYQRVKEMVEHQKEKYGWEFIFLGANIDAVSEAAKFGVSEDRAANYHSDGIGTQLNYEVVGEAISAYRSVGSLDEECLSRIKADYKERRK
ncbi:VWA domain-containing protein [Clostridiales bacterium COT073_COT-073]|nr:VWA domain-containing protein [Clostridiales bacterium COT073_COT-073]